MIQSLWQAVYSLRPRAARLDLLTLLVNLAGLLLLAPWFSALAAQAGAGQASAKIAMAAFCLAIVFLQPAVAVLRRRRAHQRDGKLSSYGVFFSRRFGSGPALVYFILQVVFLVYAAILLDEAVSKTSPVLTLLALLIFGVPFLAAVDTFLVGYYFVAPSEDGPAGFMGTAASEVAGDALALLNVLCYQVLWWYLLSDAFFTRPAQSLIDVFPRLLAVVVIAVFFYLPPRLFYLAEERQPLAAGLSMLLANLPVLVHILI